MPSSAPSLRSLTLLVGGVALSLLFSSCHRGAPAVAEPPPNGPARAPQAVRLRYLPTPIGWGAEGRPVVSHVALHDLDGDGKLDILVADARRGSVSVILQGPGGVFTEKQLGEPIAGPAHVAVADVNGDGKPDLLVAAMGQILPNNDRLGKVIILENQGGLQFRTRVVAEDLARVSDLRGADLNGDGLLDLVAGQFGYEQGEIQWFEQKPDGSFVAHPLWDRPGTIMTPVADFDADGRLDIAAIVSQDDEAIQLFRNEGRGQFTARTLWKSDNKEWGASGLEVVDLNRDGRPDLVATNGDGFNVGFTEPAPWHGLQWLENVGGRFVYHRLGDMAGCYSPVASDLDGDGDLDLVAVSAFNHTIDTESVWLQAWLNDGKQNFTPVPLANSPTCLITLAVGDIDGDGVPELITGGFHAYPPFESMSRVTLWRKAP